MRNLKRALSLALAAVMVIGMMVVGAGAAGVEDFTDKDEIKHQEAVNVLTLLNVINGKEDGSYFDPTGSLTRAEMAKLVVFILHGGKEPVLGTKATPTYSDIKGTWAEAYIEYCSSVGIIAGDGAGKFNPTGSLTGSQAAKMLLVAMNYDAKVFNFTGSNWEINVNREANKAKLYDELDGMNASAVITRDQAAQLVYNAIQSQTMELSWNQNWSTGEVVQTYELKGPTLLFDKFGAQTFVGSFSGNYNTGDTSSKGEVAVYGKLTTDETNVAKRTARFPADLDIAGIGEEFKVIFKDGTGGTVNQPDKKDTIYGVFNTGSTEVVNTTKDGIASASSYTEAGKIKVDGSVYKVDTNPIASAAIIVKNYGAISPVLNDATPVASELKAAFQGLPAQSGDTVKFILNDDGEVAMAYVVESKLAKVTAVSSTKVTLSGVGATVNIGGTLATLANVTNGDVTIGGAVTTVTNITSGSVIFNDTVAAVTNISGGDVVFNRAVTTVTDITAGNVTFNGAASDIKDISGGTVNINSTAKIDTAVTLGSATISLGGSATLTLGTGSTAINVASATFNGVTDTKIVVGSSAVTVAANQLYSNTSTGVGAGVASTGTYDYGALAAAGTYGFVKQP